MCFKVINSDTIRLIGLLDLILTVLTVLLALHIYNINTELVKAKKANCNERKLQNPEIGNQKIYEIGNKIPNLLIIGFIVAPLMMFLVNGCIVCCVRFYNNIYTINQLVLLYIILKT